MDRGLWSKIHRITERKRDRERKRMANLTFDESCSIAKKKKKKKIKLHDHTTKGWTVANTSLSAADSLKPSPSSTDFWDKSWFRLSSNACCFPSLAVKSLQNFTHFFTYQWRKWRRVTCATATSKWVWCWKGHYLILRWVHDMWRHACNITLFNVCIG